MIRETEDDVAELPSNLRLAAHDPSSWDVPGLLRDAAARIEWLEVICRANAPEPVDQLLLTDAS